MELYRDICSKLDKEENSEQLKNTLKQAHDSADELEILSKDCYICISLGGLSFDRRNEERNTACEYGSEKARCEKAYCNIDNIISELKRKSQ